FPHHAFDRLVGLTVIFRIFFLVVFHHDLAFDGKIDELSYWHTLIDLHRLLYRDLEGPVAAKADVPFASGGMDIDTQAAGGGFAFEEWDVGMGLRIFMGHAQIKDMRV